MEEIKRRKCYFIERKSSKNMLKDFFPKRKKGGIFQAQKKGKNEIYTNNKGRRINFNWTVFLFTQQIKYIHQCWLADGNFVFSSGLMEFSSENGKRTSTTAFFELMWWGKTLSIRSPVYGNSKVSPLCVVLARLLIHSIVCLFARC